MSANHEPLRITFTLGSPMVEPEDPIHLDALLAWASVDKAREAGDTSPLDAQNALPLSRIERGDQWCWQASWISCTPVERFQPSHTLKVCREHAAMMRRTGILRTSFKVTDTSRGFTKAGLYSCSLLVVNQAIAYCVGNREEIASLLSRLHGLGKRTRAGAGDILGIDVEPDEDAIEYSFQRNLPWPEAEDYVVVEGNVMAPYWDKTTFNSVYRPISPSF